MKSVPVVFYCSGNMKSRTIATLLCLFLGGFGAHRFYLGQTGRGGLCVMFCWTFIPAFVAVINFLCFYAMSEETFDLKYNQPIPDGGMP